MSERLVIQGGRPLKGRLVASGSKNAALYALAAALLTREPVVLHHVPEIADIEEMGRLLDALGATSRSRVRTLRSTAPASRAPRPLPSTSPRCAPPSSSWARCSPASARRPARRPAAT